MECVWRRRTPALVRSLLLSDPEMSKDEEHSSSSSSSSVRPCGLCLSEPARYTCPRCSAPYCSLSCYRGSAHSDCSELFYRECVSEELRQRQRSRVEHQDRSHMRDILLRLRRADGVDRVMRELVESSGGRVTDNDTETLILLSRLAEIQTDREEGREDEVREDEVRDILQRLGQTDGEEDEEDVVTRLAGLNVEALDEAELWKLLPEKDRRRFEQLLKDGGIGALVPVWRPWWEEHERAAAVLIEELQQEEERTEHVSSSEEGLQRHAHQPDTVSEPPSPRKQEEKLKESRNAPPPISCEIPPLSSLCSASPSPLVKFSLVNVLYAYAFTLRRFNGDVSETQQLLEFAQFVLSVCESLGRGRMFGSFSEALSAAMTSVSAQRHHRDSAPSAAEAVAHILSGASGADRTGYTLSALAQLRAVFSRARVTAPRDHAQFRRMCFLAEKKCEFLQAWASENTHTLSALARWAWSESQSQTAERQEMERDAKQVEGDAKQVEGDAKKKRASGKVLIEEM